MITSETGCESRKWNTGYTQLAEELRVARWHEELCKEHSEVSASAKGMVCAVMVYKVFILQFKFPVFHSMYPCKTC